MFYIYGLFFCILVFIFIFVFVLIALFRLLWRKGDKK